MANWLQKIRPPLRPPVASSQNLPSTIWKQNTFTKRPSKKLPNASIIYGIAAAVLVVCALILMFVRHHWFGGLLVLLPAAALTGFALHFLKYSR